MKFLRRSLLTFILFAVTLLLLDVTLFTLDPLGLMKYRRSLHTFSNVAATTDRATGYALVPGRHFFDGWVMTINTDGTRWVPDTNHEADTTLAFIGDSVTMGMGVDDYDTWVNLVAQEFPDLHIINAGVAGFNSRNVRLMQAQIEADFYIYYIEPNDVKARTPGLIYPPDYWQSAVFEHMRFAAATKTVNRALDYVRFHGDISALAEQGVVIVKSGDVSVDAIEVDRWTSNISRADGHADERGNMEIAEGMIEVVRSILDEGK